MEVANITRYSRTRRARDQVREIPSVVYLRPGRYMVMMIACRDKAGAGFISLSTDLGYKFHIPDSGAYRLVCSGTHAEGVHLEPLELNAG